MERTQRMVDTLFEADPEFVTLCKTLYGDAIDAEVVWKDVFSKITPEQADLNAQAKRQRTQARVGMASNALGLTAGGLGLKAALQDERFTHKSNAPKRIGNLAAKLETLPSPLSSKKGKVGAALATGALATQAANIGGDLVVNRIVAREAKRQKKAAQVTTAKRYTGNVGYAVPLDEVSKIGIKLPKLSNPLRRSPGGAPKAVGTTDQAVQTAATTPKPATAPKPPTPPAPKAGPESKQKPKLVRPGTVAVGSVGAVGAGYVGAKAMSGRRRASAAQPVVAMKRDTDPDIEWGGTFSKLDPEKRLAFGWASVLSVGGVPVVDKQGDYIHPDDLEQAAYEYVMKSRRGGDMHKRDGDEPYHASDMVESMVLTPEKIEKMGLPSDTPVGWWVGFRVNDPTTWEDVKVGKRQGFSIHGKGRRHEVDYDTIMGW